MKTIKTLLLGLFIVILILFVVQNLRALSHTESLGLNIFFTSFQSPPVQMSALLIICFAAGFLIAFLWGYAQRRRLKKTIKELRQTQTRAGEELKSLRNLPITGDMASDAQVPSENGGAD
ncbi:MAG: LapA family protein [Thermodesulfobacteriota bacterium]|nr:LapA family protein [Thermodesulfobacteriota bacterium]